MRIRRRAYRNTIMLIRSSVLYGTLYRVASIRFCIFQRCTSHRTMYMTYCTAYTWIRHDSVKAEYGTFFTPNFTYIRSSLFWGVTMRRLVVLYRHFGKKNIGPIFYGVRSGPVGWGTALQAGRSRVRFPMVSPEFFIEIILPAALWSRGWFSL